MRALQEGATVSFIDPLVVQESVPWAERLDHTVAWTPSILNTFDCIVLAVKQPGLRYDILEHLNVQVEKFVS
jgi:hypothetical protein